MALDRGKELVGNWRKAAAIAAEAGVTPKVDSQTSSSLPLSLPDPSPVRKVPQVVRGDVLVALNEKYEKAHIYCSNIFPCRSLCNQWDCGSPTEPTCYASFLRKDDSRWLELAPEKWCGKCFTKSRLANLTCSHPFAPRLDAMLEDESEVSSVATDSSDEN